MPPISFSNTVEYFTSKNLFCNIRKFYELKTLAKIVVCLYDPSKDEDEVFRHYVLSEDTVVVLFDFKKSFDFYLIKNRPGTKFCFLPLSMKFFKRVISALWKVAPVSYIYNDPDKNLPRWVYE